MKIVIDARIMDKSSGIGRYISHLLNELQKMDSHNQYIVLLRKTNFDLWSPSAKNFSKILADYRYFSLKEQLGFYLFLYKLKPDLVHFTNINHPIFYFGKKIINVHDFTLVKYKNVRGSKFKYEFKYWAFRFVLWYGIRTARAIITISNYVRKTIHLKYRVPTRKIHLTYPAVDISTVSTRAYKPMVNKKFLLYVGAAYSFKNLDRMIQAFNLIKTKHGDTSLVIVGKHDDFYERLQEKIKESNIDRVVFTGFIPDDQLEWLYKHAVAYVFPSLSEGFGLPGLEAMSYGLPVISSSATCLPEIYGEAVHYFDPQNVDDMASKMSQVLDDKDLRMDLIKRGYAQVNKYSWNKMAEQTIEIYNKTL